MDHYNDSAVKYGFTAGKWHNRSAYKLKIDDNLKLVLIPNYTTLDYELIGPRGRILLHGVVMAGTDDPVVRAIQTSEEWLSKSGTMLTYGSINLKTKTGIGPLTGASGKDE